MPPAQTAQPHADSISLNVPTGPPSPEFFILASTLCEKQGDLAQAREEKDAPLVFVASACGPGSVVFDGQGPNAGEHMTYRRAGDAMTFIGDFIHGGQPVRAEVEFKRAGN